jgi:hypothetical protein
MMATIWLIAAALIAGVYLLLPLLVRSTWACCAVAPDEATPRHAGGAGIAAESRCGCAAESLSALIE